MLVAPLPPEQCCNKRFPSSFTITVIVLPRRRIQKRKQLTSALSLLSTNGCMIRLACSTRSLSYRESESPCCQQNRRQLSSERSDCNALEPACVAGISVVFRNYTFGSRTGARKKLRRGWGRERFPSPPWYLPPRPSPTLERILPENERKRPHISYIGTFCPSGYHFQFRVCLKRDIQFHICVLNRAIPAKHSPFLPLRPHNFYWFRAPSLKCVKTQTYVLFVWFWIR